MRDVRVRMHRKVKENWPTAMEHQVTEEPGDRSVHVEGSKPGARRRKENWPTAMEHQDT